MRDPTASQGAPTGKAPLRVLAGVDQTVDGLLEELTEVLEALREGHRELAESPDPGGPREEQMTALLERREGLGARIGLEIVRIVAAGGTIRVEGSKPASAAFRPTEVDEPSEEPTADLLLAETPAPPAHPAPPPTRPPAPHSAPEVAPAPEQATAEEPPRPVERPRAQARPPASVAPLAPSAPGLGRELPGTGPASGPLAAEAPRPRRGRSLRQTLDTLGPPVRVSTEEEAAAAVGRLVDACGDLDEWLAHPTEVQRALVGLTSSMARYLQDESEVLDRNATRALGTWFSTMTRWSGLYKPGFVRGLSRMNRPERPTWLADWGAWFDLLTERVTLDGDARGARFDVMSSVFAGSGLLPSAPPPPPAARPPSVAPPAAEAPPPPTEGAALRELEAVLRRPDSDLEAALKVVLDAGVGQKDPRLVALLGDHRERVAALRGLKTLKSALKFARTPTGRPESEPAPEPTMSSGLPDSWPFYALTRGVNAVVVGGDPRPTDRMRDAFGFASVTWDPIDPRRVDALAARIRALSVEFVVLLRDFVSHSVADAVISSCKDANVPYVVVDAGYGVGQVRLAIERYLQGRLPQQD